MLRWLRIQDVVLVREAELLLGPGLNVLTGETGSGKSAITRALGLLLGQRADSELIREGCAVGVVEAEFTVGEQVERLLHSGGVDFEMGEPLLVRRELYAHGRHRAFVNSQPAHVSLIRLLGPYLVEFVGQSANHSLRDPMHHLKLLDQFAKIDVGEFQQALQLERQASQALLDWQVHEAESIRLQSQYSRELEELEELDLQEGEEEELFEEFKRLSTFEERRKLLSGVAGVLTEGNPAVIPLLTTQLGAIDQLQEKEVSEVYRSALLELEEVARTVQLMQSSTEGSPERLAFVESRLSEIDKLNRRYGDLFAYRQKLEQELLKLSQREEQESTLKDTLELKREEVEKLAAQISKRRTVAATEFGELVSEQIQTLNMADSTFSVRLEKSQRTLQGDEKVEFFLQPNAGESPLSVAEQISGGELARVMLALKSLLVGSVGMLLFDEVDANIGGKTADRVGSRLKEIGSQQQVLCITHFPQVAQYGDMHFLISKEGVGGRTVTRVEPLQEKDRQAELQRMQGAPIGV